MSNFGIWCIAKAKRPACDEQVTSGNFGNLDLAAVLANGNTTSNIDIPLGNDIVVDGTNNNIIRGFDTAVEGSVSGLVVRAGNSTTTFGGGLDIFGGASTVSGGGNINIAAGSAAPGFDGGSLVLRSGIPTGGAVAGGTGDVFLTVGFGAQTDPGGAVFGGDLTIESGAGGDATATLSSGIPGRILMLAGNGGDASSAFVGQDGAEIQILSGFGGDGEVGFNGQDGGRIVIFPGSGGNGGTMASTPGNGGRLELQSGNSGGDGGGGATGIRAGHIQLSVGSSADTTLTGEIIFNGNGSNKSVHLISIQGSTEPTNTDTNSSDMSGTVTHTTVDISNPAGGNTPVTAITFEKAYASVPTVVVGISIANLSAGTILQANGWAENVTASGFDIAGFALASGVMTTADLILNYMVIGKTSIA